MIELKLWQMLILASVLGAVAALISQFTAAKKGLEAGAKARTLRENVNNLVKRNAVRRNNLKDRQKILDEHVELNIKHQKGQLDDKALKEAIGEEKKRIASLTEAIKKSEVAITETRTRLAEVEQEKVLSGSLLAAFSVLIGAATAAIFGLIGFLGLKSGTISFSQDFPLTSNVVVQSLALGAGWPLVWEKFFAADKLDSAANAAASHFEITIKEAEKEEV
jgi:hypothetical protein